MSNEPDNKDLISFPEPITYKFMNNFNTGIVSHESNMASVLTQTIPFVDPIPSVPSSTGGVAEGIAEGNVEAINTIYRDGGNGRNPWDDFGEAPIGAHQITNEIMDSRSFLSPTIYPNLVPSMMDWIESTNDPFNSEGMSTIQREVYEYLKNIALEEDNKEASIKQEKLDRIKPHFNFESKRR